MNPSSQLAFFTIPIREMSLRTTKAVDAARKAIVMPATTGPLLSRAEASGVLVDMIGLAASSCSKADVIVVRHYRLLVAVAPTTSDIVRYTLLHRACCTEQDGYAPIRLFLVRRPP